MFSIPKCDKVWQKFYETSFQNSLRHGGGGDGSWGKVCGSFSGFSCFHERRELRILSGIYLYFFNIVENVEKMYKIRDKPSILSKGILTPTSVVSQCATNSLVHLVSPQTVSLIRCGGSVEPCCGTHVLNTCHLVNFCIVAIKTTAAGVKSLR